MFVFFFFFFQAEDGIRDHCVTGVQTCALPISFAAVRLGGRVQLLGIPKGEIPIDFAREIIFKGITVYGVTGRKMYETWHQMRRYLTAGLLDPRPVITHQFRRSEERRVGKGCRSRWATSQS